jgi:hypothetical protein
MAYSNFTLAQVKTDFNLKIDETRSLFGAVAGVEPSERLRLTLQEDLPLATAINTEKARSEFLIAPILSEVRRQAGCAISLFSGSEFNVDPAQGLVGFCDFILCRSPEQYFISHPVAIVIEAKNENIVAGLGQCLAAMVAAQRFNEKAGNSRERICGAVTTGTNWKFLTLEGQLAAIDGVEYYINEIDKILGILLQPFQKLEAAIGF